MEDETGGVRIEEFVGLKLKMYLFLVDDNSVDKKAKGVNRNIIAAISHKARPSSSVGLWTPPTLF